MFVWEGPAWYAGAVGASGRVVGTFAREIVHQYPGEAAVGPLASSSRHLVFSLFVRLITPSRTGFEQGV